MKLATVLALSAAALAAPAAGARTPERFAVSVEGGYLGLSAADSAKALFDSSGGFVFGGELRVRLKRSWFAGAGVRTFNREGERVFVDAGTVFKLGHPLKLRLRPIYGFVGFRYRPEAAIVPYIAVGGGVTSYREESVIGGQTDVATASKGTWHVALGADYALGAVSVGAEARYTSVPDAIGLAGVSRAFGEKDLGGFTVVGRLSFGR